MKYGLNNETIEKICSVFAEFPAVEKAVLYGSRAKGNYKTGSDIDLTLFGANLTEDLRGDIAEALDDLLLPYTIDLSIFEELNHAKLREHIERVGVVFYERAKAKKGWEVRRLEELYEIARGGSPRPIKNYMTTELDGINWIKISDATASTKYIYETKEKIKPEGIKMSRLVHEGDFILSNSMSFGRPYIMKTTGCIHDGWLVLHPKSDQINNDYMYYLLGSDVVYKQFDQLAAGSTVRNLNSDLVRGVEVLIPPIAEQQKIVAVLDEAFAGIATATENAKKNLANARELFESHLQTIFTTKGNGWVEKKLGDVCDVRDGTHDSPKYVDNGIPFITQKNIRKEGLSFSGTKFISQKDHDNFYRRSNVCFGDILISMIGANRGMVCIVDDKRDFSIKNVGLIKSNNNISKHYLLYFLKSQIAAEYVDLASKGGAQEFIGLTKLREFPIIFAPLPEQQRIVTELDALSAETKRLEAIYQQKLENLTTLKQSILQKAFAGELNFDRIAA